MQPELEDWRVLSLEASKEEDPEKLLHLIERLNRALFHDEVEMKQRVALY
jgi:hypothetical protein